MLEVGKMGGGKERETETERQTDRERMKETK